jgi:hypothetical protein
MLCMIYAARWYPPILLWRWKLESVSFLLVCVCAAVGDPFPLSLSRCPGRQFNLLMNHKSLHHSLCQGKRDDRVIKKWEETQSRARVFLSSSHNMQRERVYRKTADAVLLSGGLHCMGIAARVCVWLSIADAVCVPLSAALTAILTCTRIGHWKIVQAYLLRRSQPRCFLYLNYYCNSRRRSSLAFKSLHIYTKLSDMLKVLQFWVNMNFWKETPTASVANFLDFFFLWISSSWEHIEVLGRKSPPALF